MKFGVFIPQGWRLDLVGIDPSQHWGVMAGLARRADGIEGWTSLWVYDHLHTFPEPTQEATHEAWTLMAAFAGVTGRIRLGQMCTCMSYRNPAYLAKVAATTDIVSEGRVEMGIGAGWYEQEWRAYGYGFPAAKERLGRLREGVEIFRQMWTQGEATLEGTYYSADGARCYPQPLQGTSVPGSSANGIPMWIAGGGEKVTLKIAAEYADYTNFSGDPEEFTAKSDILREHCESLGRDMNQIVRSSNYDVIIGRDQDEIDGRLAGIEARLVDGGVSAEAVQDRMAKYRDSLLCGTPEQLLERLTQMEELGMTYAICNFPEAAYDTTGMELFERDVMPELLDTKQHGHLWHLLHGE